MHKITNFFFDFDAETEIEHDVKRYKKQHKKVINNQHMLKEKIIFQNVIVFSFYLF